MVVDFRELQFRLIRLLQDRIRSGEISERRLAQMVEVSQPHLHNVLKGKYIFSMSTADRILRHLRLDLLDLIDPRERRP